MSFFCSNPWCVSRRVASLREVRSHHFRATRLGGFFSQGQDVMPRWVDYHYYKMPSKKNWRNSASWYSQRNPSFFVMQQSREQWRSPQFTKEVNSDPDRRELSWPPRSLRILLDSYRVQNARWVFENPVKGFNRQDEKKMHLNTPLKLMAWTWKW